MGLFSAFKLGFNEGRERAHNEAKERRKRDSCKVVKLVEPNYGRIVTFQIITDEPVWQMYVDLIVTLADGLKAKTTVSGKTVTLHCPDYATAEAVRETWK